MNLKNDTAPRPAEEHAFDAQLGESLGYLLRDTYRLISRRLQTRIADHGIGLGQWYFLRALWIEDGMTQRELSARVGMGEPTAVTALRSLEAEKLIRRVGDPKDGRRKRVFLTPKGRALEESLLPIAAEINREAAAELTGDELRQLKTLIRRVRDTLRKED